MGVPERLVWAVDTLGVRHGERILEIGCGRGVAVGLIRERGGEVTAIDRSAKMIAIARERNPGACFMISAVEDDRLSGPYDKIFSVNVNLFWTRSPARELEIIRRLLAPGGRLYAFYESPGGRDQSAKVAEGFVAGGFSAEILREGGLIGVTGRPSP
ncbi:class I SAM-dependent methyltransferase [Nonomuraea sp. NBC_01738]|uniref:class I SAM-dependent methyltransferase n=1 Tax=Nonomuraea sp. NBC_01738 TaxID=2976003 RepID=UPI002E161609|nr:class I SAM-dependent methyltransferase [Nonomuraea sp. NBC_01738]